MLLLILLGSYVSLNEGHRNHPSYPVRVAPTLLTDTDSSCPSLDTMDKEMSRTRDVINNNYRLRPCSCGGPGWTRVGYVNMSDPDQHCPSNWTQHDSPVRGCGRTSTGYKTCDSVILPVNNISYSKVCGRIQAYQRGASYAFGNAPIDDPYVSGVSLTHGAAGVREHVWTFAGALDETTKYNYPLWSCPCINTTHMWGYQLPSFVGESYFCDAGINTFTSSDFSKIYTDDNKVYTDDPLWDGEGCGGSSTCCSFNHPPWFCKHLQHHTTDDLEVRLCGFWYERIEDKWISQMEIYIK